MSKKSFLFFTLLLFLAACQTRSPDDVATNPVVTRSTPEPGVSSVSVEEHLRELVRFVRRESEAPEARMQSGQARLKSLPQPLTEESVTLDGSKLAPELVLHLNGLRDEEETDWATDVVEEANQNISPSAEFSLALSRPVRLGDGRWYSAVEWLQSSGAGSAVKEVALVGYTYDNGEFSDAEYRTLLRASSVRR